MGFGWHGSRSTPCMNIIMNLRVCTLCTQMRTRVSKHIVCATKQAQFSLWNARLQWLATTFLHWSWEGKRQTVRKVTQSFPLCGVQVFCTAGAQEARGKDSDLDWASQWTLDHEPDTHTNVLSYIPHRDASVQGDPQICPTNLACVNEYQTQYQVIFMIHKYLKWCYI